MSSGGVSLVASVLRGGGWDENPPPPCEFEVSTRVKIWLWYCGGGWELDDYGRVAYGGGVLCHYYVLQRAAPLGVEQRSSTTLALVVSLLGPLPRYGGEVSCLVFAQFSFNKLSIV